MKLIFIYSVYYAVYIELVGQFKSIFNNEKQYFTMLLTVETLSYQ